MELPDPWLYGHIIDAARRLVKLAKEVDDDVETTFNRVRLRACPFHPPYTLEAAGEEVHFPEQKPTTVVSLVRYYGVKASTGPLQEENILRMLYDDLTPGELKERYSDG